MSSDFDDANEAYLDLKESKSKKKDDGQDRRLKKTGEAAKLRRSSKNTLGAHNLVFTNEEREIWKAHYDDIKAEIVDTWGEFKASHKLTLNLLCYGVIRFYRKSRLEANFGRFFDRMAPHDPVAQILSVMAKLGLLNADKGKDAQSSSKLSRLISEEADGLQNQETGEAGDGKISREEWLAKQINGGTLPEVQFRTPQVRRRYDDDEVLDGGEDEEVTSS